MKVNVKTINIKRKQKQNNSGDGLNCVNMQFNVDFIEKKEYNLTVIMIVRKQSTFYRHLRSSAFIRITLFLFYMHF